MMVRILTNKNGFTLVEVLIAFAITLTLFLALAAGILSIKSLNLMARHHIQAVNVARGAVETLKGLPYASIVNNAGTTVAYDAGGDNVYGTADDLTGTLTVTIQDFLDMDNDADVAETDGVGFFNGMAKPIRVQFIWNEFFLGNPQTRSVIVDTLIAT